MSTNQIKFKSDVIINGNFATETFSVAKYTNTTLPVDADDGTLAYNSDAESLVIYNAGTTSWDLTTEGFGGTRPQGVDKSIIAVDDGDITGDTRGDFSVDLQTKRASTTQVVNTNNSVITGGEGNEISSTAGNHNVISGGDINKIETGYQSFIGSGRNNRIVGGGVNIITGGESNEIFGNWNNAIFGGQTNTIGDALLGTSEGNYVAFGYNNTINYFQYGDLGGDYNSICGGGQDNHVSGGDYNTMGGGLNNHILGSSSIGIIKNTLTLWPSYNIMIGGRSNIIEDASYSTILGGVDNKVSKSYSLVFGQAGETINESVVLFADGSTNTFQDVAANSFNIQASGGLRLVDGNEGADKVLVSDAAGTGHWQSIPNPGTIQAVEGTYDIRAAVSNGTATTPRGEGSIDLQTARNNVDQVAAGVRSAIVGGINNKITSNSINAVIFGGTTNEVSQNDAVVIGGGSNISNSTRGAIIAGQNNITQTGNYAVVLGGDSNTSEGDGSITSGETNKGSGEWATVLGGRVNEIQVGSARSSIIGGTNHVISGTNEDIGIFAGNNHAVSGLRSAVLGGKDAIVVGTNCAIVGGTSNSASGNNAVVGGGTSNKGDSNDAFVTGNSNEISNSLRAAVIGGKTNNINGTGTNHVIIGGTLNIISSADVNSSILGGNNNTISSGNNSSILGGQSNTAAGEMAVVLGGANNTGNGVNAFIGGGSTNFVNTISGGAIIGGIRNIVSGTNGVVLGGSDNIASAAETLCAGDFATASHNGARVFADHTTNPIASKQNSEFTIQASILRLEDGNEAVGKVLTCNNADGSGNWADTTNGTVQGTGATAYNIVAADEGAFASTTARGENSVDLQTDRDAVDQVASGANSAIIGGFSNKASNTGSVVAGGNNNTAGGLYSGVVAGQRNVASGLNSIVLGGSDSTASGIDSLAAGDNATVTHDGARLFAGADDIDFPSIANGEFAIQGSALRLVDGNQGSGKVLTCDANGSGNWAFHDGVGESVTGTATFTNSTNTIALTGIGLLTGLAVGDVIEVTGSTSGNNDNAFTVESITSNSITVNGAHAGRTPDSYNRSLEDQTSVAGVTVTLTSKANNAPFGYGQALVDVKDEANRNTPWTNFTNTTGRPQYNSVARVAIDPYDTNWIFIDDVPVDMMIETNAAGNPQGVATCVCPIGSAVKIGRKSSNTAVAWADPISWYVMG
jgi:hypothetical protein